MFGSNILEHVVIQGLTVGSWAKLKGCTEQAAMGVLFMVLERLVEHWREVSARDRAERLAKPRADEG